MILIDWAEGEWNMNSGTLYRVVCLPPDVHWHMR